MTDAVLRSLSAAGIDVELERVATRWWPPAEVVRVGAWTMRAADGFTGRANSAAPLHLTDADAPADLAAIIDAAADFSGRRGLPVRFQIPDTPRTGTIRTALSSHGFRPEQGDDHVMVMVSDLSTVPPGAGGVVHRPDPDDGWVRCWWAVSPRGDRLVAGRALLERMPLPRTFARIGDDRAPDAVGLAALVDGWVGLGAIAVSSDRRRRGFGRALTAGLMAWARGVGADRAFLQVASENDPAVRLYRDLGFVTAYTYRYWSLGDGR